MGEPLGRRKFCIALNENPGGKVALLVFLFDPLEQKPVVLVGTFQMNHEKQWHWVIKAVGI